MPTPQQANKFKPHQIPKHKIPGKPGIPQPAKPPKFKTKQIKLKQTHDLWKPGSSQKQNPQQEGNTALNPSRQPAYHNTKPRNSLVLRKQTAKQTQTTRNHKNQHHINPTKA